MFASALDVTARAAIEAEEAARIAGDTALADDIAAETAARIAADLALDESLAPVAKTGVAADVAFTPAGGVSATDVQAAIEEAAAMGGGEPGGVARFKTRTAAIAATIDETVDAVATLGYSSEADGGEDLYKRVAIEPDHGGKFQSADGAWWERAIRPANPRQFGAKTDGTDSAAALQAFFDSVMAVDVGTAHVGGVFHIGTGVVVTGPASTRTFVGAFEPVALAPIAKLLTLQNVGFTHWEHIIATGTGGTSFAGRTCEVGVFFDDSARTTIAKMRARNFSFAGVYAGPNNNSLANFGDLSFRDCGSGHGSEPDSALSLFGEWSNPVNSGSSGSVSQRTTVDVTALPPSYILNETYGTIGSNLYMVRIDGRLYYIYGVDATAGTLTIFPWLPSTAVPGTFQYVFGGGISLHGANSNVSRIGMVDAIRCGIGLGAGSSYGPYARRVAAQFCGIGLAIGRNPSSVTLGGSFDAVYLEENNEDILQVVRGRDTQYNMIHGEYAVSLDKCYNLGAPRFSNDELSSSFETFANLPFTRRSRK